MEADGHLGDIEKEMKRKIIIFFLVFHPVLD